MAAALRHRACCSATRGHGPCLGTAWQRRPCVPTCARHDQGEGTGPVDGGGSDQGRREEEAELEEFNAYFSPASLSHRRLHKSPLSAVPLPSPKPFTPFTPAGSTVAGRGALMIAAAQPPPARLLAGGAATVAAAALAGMSAAGAQVVAAPLAGELSMAQNLLLHLATPARVSARKGAITQY